MMKAILPLLICLGTTAGAQQTVTNRGQLQVHTGGAICFFGDLANAAGATLANNGNLYIRGNISSNGTSSGSGTVHLNGSSMQTLSGSQAFRTFNLTTNNSAGIQLDNDLNISGTHNFAAGIIFTSSTPNYLVYEAGASHTGSSDNRHIAGWTKKSGTTDFEFPVGNGTYLRTVGIRSLSAASVFTARYGSPTPGTGQLQAPLASIDPYEYWTVNRESGGNASVALNWHHSKVNFVNWSIPEIRIARYNGSSWVSEGGSATGNATSTGAITSGSLSDFGMFTFASSAYPLPLTLLRFDARLMDGYTQLYWKTESELNVDHFVVQRSDDGTAFYPVGQASARNTGSIESYMMRDLQPVNGVAYYRLLSVDMDGSKKLSQIVKVMTEAGKGMVLAFNPVRDKLTLVALDRTSGLFGFAVYNSGGQLLSQGSINAVSNRRTEIALPPSVRPGIYTIRLSNGKQDHVLRFLVE
ncbi:MAG TPA: T9SS type A sorting domain-containing protein [Flavisolibacter sp.]|nr:T9SS type A sorting domain-containing protein [Flavisolibacter sp.]